MKVLSLRQPWAWAVVHGGKTIENRVWPTRFRGRFLIHAAQGMTRAEYTEARAFIEKRIAPTAPRFPPLPAIVRGGIIGIATLVDCRANLGHSPQFAGDLAWVHRPDAARWAMEGQFGFLLEDVRAVPLIECKGSLGFFDASPDVLKRLAATGIR